MKFYFIFLLVTIISIIGTGKCFCLPSFPGAEGFGAITTGGRGGEVKKVTNLEDTGPGSFREAVSGNEPKIVVFDVSGIIRIKSRLTIGENTTIAGQTAPEGGGITFYGWNRDPEINNGFPINDNIAGNNSAQNGTMGLSNNIIIRHIRMRGCSYKGDGISGGWNRFLKNIILDHVSVSWAGDESISFASGSQNVTIQWCTVEESINFWHGEGPHGYGVFFYSSDDYPGGNLTLHHTLLSHHDQRCPLIEVSPEFASDVRNCVLYNTGLSTIAIGLGYGVFAGDHNYINNYKRSGVNGNRKELLNICFGKNYTDTIMQYAPEIHITGSKNVSYPQASDNDLWYVWADPNVGGGGDAAPFMVNSEISMPHVATQSTDSALVL
ncbi:MAG: hypothetical protein ABIA63_08835 [bacterium]